METSETTVQKGADDLTVDNSRIETVLLCTVVVLVLNVTENVCTVTDDVEKTAV